jgi:hypothetical protein
LVYFPAQAKGDAYKNASLCVIAARFSPFVVNNALQRRGELTPIWLIAFVPGLILDQNMRFLPRKREKARREKIR